MREERAARGKGAPLCDETSVGGTKTAPERRAYVREATGRACNERGAAPTLTPCHSPPTHTPCGPVGSEEYAQHSRIPTMKVRRVGGSVSGVVLEVMHQCCDGPASCANAQADRSAQQHMHVLAPCQRRPPSDPPALLYLAYFHRSLARPSRTRCAATLQSTQCSTTSTAGRWRTLPAGEACCFVSLKAVFLMTFSWLAHLFFLPFMGVFLASCVVRLCCVLLDAWALACIRAAACMRARVRAGLGTHPSSPATPCAPYPLQGSGRPAGGGDPHAAAAQGDVFGR